MAETPQFDNPQAEIGAAPIEPSLPTLGQGDDIAADLAEVETRPEGFRDVSPSFLMRLVRNSVKPGNPFPIPEALKRWGVQRLGETITSSRSSGRMVASAVKTLALLERLNLDAKIHDEGSRVEVTHRFAPQDIQAGLEAYARKHGATLGTHPGGNGHGNGPSIARLVGGRSNGHSETAVPNPPPRNGHGSNGHGAFEGGNGGGHSHS